MASLARPAPPLAPRWSPARAWRRVTPVEGWSSVILLGIIQLTTAWSVARTEVAPDAASMVILAIGGLLTGLVLAKLRAPDLLAHLIAVQGGIICSLLLAVERMPLADGGRLQRLRALGDLGATWLAQAQAGQQLDDPRLLVIMLGAAVWLVSYTSAWVLFRRGWLTTAVALPVVIALANLGYAPEAGSLPLLVIIAAATVLAARYSAYRRQVAWSRARLPYPRRTAPRFLFAGIAIAALVALLAWTLPLSAREAISGAAWDRLSEPLEEIAERWNELAAKLGGASDSGGGSYSAFGDSFRLGGHLDLTDDPVMLLRPSGGPMRPPYLAGQRYDAYDGHGWQSTVDETFDAIAPDGRRFSSRLSFATGQGMHLSPEVTSQRSQVEGELNVIRPKGDLLFTLDTFFSADRRTNVELPWLQLQNAPFSLAPGDLPRLPIDLKAMGALLAQGQYTPTSDGGVNDESPLPLDPTLAAEVQTARDALQQRFLAVTWEIGPDGRAQTLYVTGQMPVYDDAEAVFSQEQVIEGESYAVTGLTSVARPEQLRAAGADYPAWVTDRYLQLPDTITGRTRELAAQIASGQPSPFDTASAVEEYVRSTITYNESINPPPDGQDVVDYVLFDSQEGYCEYYASAMAVLLRAEGIPSRVVGGYFPAPYDPAESGHLFREKNAHLWGEGFVPGYGWVPFEPTANRDQLSYGDLNVPPAALPTPVPTPEPAPESSPVAEPTPEPSPVAAPPEEPPRLTPPAILSDPARLAGWIGIILAAVMAVAVVGMTVAWFTGFRGLSPVSGLYSRALRAGNWLGVRPTPSLTPREYAERVGRTVPSAQGPARVVADLYTAERYSGRRPDNAALHSARQAWRELRGIALGSLFRRQRGDRGR